jgi:type II secretory pathway pseudopilin PulG
MRQPTTYNLQPTTASRGFTIIEAVLSVSIFAMAMTSIIGVYLSVQRINQASASLQALQQNARFISEDISKIIRNGEIDYSRYPSQTAPTQSGDLYLLDKDGNEVYIYRDTNLASPTFENLMIEKQLIYLAPFSSKEVKVKDFQVLVWPATNPFPAGLEQPRVTVFLDLEANVNLRDKTTAKFQFTLTTRQYPE